MPRRAHDYRGLTQVSRLRLLRAIQRRPGILLTELAEEAGLHVNTAREHLRVLEDEGLVHSEPQPTGSRGRPPIAFHPVRSAETSPEAARRVAAATTSGDALRRLAPDLDAGTTLGADAAHQLDTLYEHLEDAGLEPQLDQSELTMTLAPCPYLRAVEEDRPLVCAVHARLVHDVLAQVPGPIELRRLDPFVTAHSCVIALGVDGEPTRSPRTRGRSASHASEGTEAT